MVLKCRYGLGSSESTLSSSRLRFVEETLTAKCSLNCWSRTSPIVEYVPRASVWTTWWRSWSWSPIVIERSLPLGTILSFPHSMGLCGPWDQFSSLDLLDWGMGIEDHRFDGGKELPWDSWSDYGLVTAASRKIMSTEKPCISHDWIATEMRFSRVNPIFGRQVWLQLISYKGWKNHLSISQPSRGLGSRNIKIKNNHLSPI